MVSVVNERQQCDLARAFNACGQLALVLGAGTGRTARDDFARFGDIPLQARHVLIVDTFDFFDTKGTNLFLDRSFQPFIGVFVVAACGVRMGFSVFSHFIFISFLFLFSVCWHCSELSIYFAVIRRYSILFGFVGAIYVRGCRYFTLYGMSRLPAF
jgi:hypothetical protein